MSATRQVLGWLPATVVRVALGVLWLHEGLLKYQAGFGSADIGLVVESAASNPRVPSYLTAFSDHVLSHTTTLFGFVMPALETALGVVLVLGVLTLPAALGSVFTLMTYWSADQLIGEYPIMVLLSVVVVAFPVAASQLSLTAVLDRITATHTSRMWRSLAPVRRWL